MCIALVHKKMSNTFLIITVLYFFISINMSRAQLFTVRQGNKAFQVSEAQSFPADHQIPSPGELERGENIEIHVIHTVGVPGSENNPINIHLRNTVGISGIQFIANFNGHLLTVRSAETTDLTTQMNIAYNVWRDSIKILLYSTIGLSIEPGDTSIIKLIFDVSNSAITGDSTLIHLKDVKVSDQNGEPLVVTAYDGWFHFSSPSGTVSEGSNSSTKPQTYALCQNFPNPFNTRTCIKYQIPKADRVILKIFNILGEEVKTLIEGEKKAGFYSVIWDGRDNNCKPMASGVYMYRLQSESFICIRKMIIQR